MTGEGVAGALGATSQHTDHYDLACFNLRDSCIALKHIRGLSLFIGNVNRVWLVAVSGFCILKCARETASDRFYVYEIFMEEEENGLEFFVFYEQCPVRSGACHGCVFRITGEWNE